MFLVRVTSPFRSGALFEMEVARGFDPVRITIYDMTGRRVGELLTVARSLATTITWDGRNQSGRRVEPGAYAYRIAHGSSTLASGTIVRVR